jgi:hypothetical protein
MSGQVNSHYAIKKEKPMNRNAVLLILVSLLIASHAFSAEKDIKVQNDGSINVTTPKILPAPNGNAPATLSPKKPKVTDYTNKNKQLNEAANTKNKLQNTKATLKPDNLKNTAKSKSTGKLNDAANQKEALKPENLKNTAKSKTTGKLKGTVNQKEQAAKGSEAGKIAETGKQIKEQSGK